LHGARVLLIGAIRRDRARTDTVRNCGADAAATHRDGASQEALTPISARGASKRGLQNESSGFGVHRAGRKPISKWGHAIRAPERAGRT
jgi:hypothetical protein